MEQSLGRSCRRLHSSYTYLQRCQQRSVANHLIKLVEFLRVVWAADSSFLSNSIKEKAKVQRTVKEMHRVSKPSQMPSPNDSGNQVGKAHRQ